MKDVLKAWAFKVCGKIGIEMMQEKNKLGEGKKYKIMITTKWLRAWFHCQECCSRNLRFFYHSSRGTKCKQLAQEYFLWTNKASLVCCDSWIQFWGQQGAVAYLAWPSLAEATRFHPATPAMNLTPGEQVLNFSLISRQNYKNSVTFISFSTNVYFCQTFSHYCVCWSLVPLFVYCL